ncbi:hypothetical protein BD410DRAFT_138925 [Rickenella mellea]|uniref:Uncharacterized protein n=1 Tax=Rickenella mellea TaxID=50990 RepID=A0A4Y7PJA3_9AGAM|nr:hypothetical protein BD410DRAFT_138925 [Rickenella mellea]
MGSRGYGFNTQFSAFWLQWVVCGYDYVSFLSLALSGAGLLHSRRLIPTCQVFFVLEEFEVALALAYHASCRIEMIARHHQPGASTEQSSANGTLHHVPPYNPQFVKKLSAILRRFSVVQSSLSPQQRFPTQETGLNAVSDA